MAGTDGLSFLRTLRADPATASLTVLLITGHDDEETRLQGFEAGADDFINKPFRPREFLARVRTHLDLARLRREEGAQRRRLEAEAALRASEERFRAIVNQATAGVAEIDASGRYTLVNRTFCDLAGYSEAELLGRRFHVLTHPDELPGAIDIFERVLATGEPVVAEKRLVRKDGAVIWINECVSLIPRDDSRPPRVVMVAIDITERKRAEEALRLSEEQFRHVVDSVRDYAIFTLDVQRLRHKLERGRRTHETLPRGGDHRPAPFRLLHARGHRRRGARTSSWPRLRPPAVPSGKTGACARTARVSGATNWCSPCAARRGSCSASPKSAAT